MEEYRGPGLGKLMIELADVVLDGAESYTQRAWGRLKAGAAHCINQTFERFEARQDVFPED